MYSLPIFKFPDNRTIVRHFMSTMISIFLQNSFKRRQKIPNQNKCKTPVTQLLDFSCSGLSEQQITVQVVLLPSVLLLSLNIVEKKPLKILNTYPCRFPVVKGVNVHQIQSS